MMKKSKKNTFTHINIKNGKTVYSDSHELFTINTAAQLKEPDIFNQNVGEAIAKARMAEIMRHLPEDINDRLIKIGHDIYNSFNKTQKEIPPVKENDLGEIKRTESQPIKFSCSDWEGDTAVSSATVCKKCGREKWEH